MTKYKRVNLVFNRESDFEILDILLTKQNKTAYIKEAIKYYENLQEFKIDRKTLKEIVKDAINEVGVGSNHEDVQKDAEISEDILNSIMNM